MDIILFNTILFIISCIVILSILCLFSWVIEDNYLKPKQDMSSSGEAKDFIIERSNGMKEEITKVCIRVQGEWVEIPNIEGVRKIDKDGHIIDSYIRKKENKEEKDMREIKKGDKVKIISDIDEDFDNEKQFTKSDLKAGDMVELRNGEIYIFIKDAKRKQYDNPTDIFMGVNSYRCIPFSHYNDNLLNSKEGKSYDIMKVSDGFYISNIFRAYPSDTFKTPDWVWEREKTEEMTLEEVCKELGRDIKIVKEH